eukprot:s4910_g2.t1
MPTGSGEPAQAADPGGQGSGSLTSLPWAQIPKFDPSSTDLRVYEQKMKFLKAIWPEEFLPHLAPRAALLVEGPAFQKVSRLDGNKLRSPDGVQYLVEALGGSWGRLATEEKFDLFERALFTVMQKQDESNDSYLSRHDIAFEDLEAKGVTFKDIRAYVLVRQSTLSSEDRKKIIMDNAGDLTYDAAKKSMRLLGSRFFQDLQGPGKSQAAKKAYDAYHTEEPEDPVPTFFQDADGDWDEESAYQLLADCGDEDAIYINEFEDQIVEALQEHPELSQCFVSYQEARARVRERAKARGFWPLKGKSKGKGGSKKGKGGFQYGGGDIGNESVHSDLRTKNDQTAPNEIHFGFLDEEDTAPEVIYELPVNATDWKEGFKVCALQQVLNISTQFSKVHNESQGVNPSYQWNDDPIEVRGEILLAEVPKIDAKFTQNLCKRLQKCCRKNLESAVASMHDQSPLGQLGSVQIKHPPDIPASPKSGAEAEPVFQFEEQSHEAIIDTGASRAVIGDQRLPSLISSCGLEGQANQELAIPKNQLPTPAEVFQRPPEVNTLRDWGKLVMPDGKHRGKTFEQAFTDQNYVFQLKNRRATSAWAKNFQMYSRCRVHYDYAHSKEMYEKGIPVTTEMLSQIVSKPSDQAIVPSEMSKAKAQSSKDNCPDDWTQVETVPKTEIIKRPASQVSGNKPSQRSMSTEPDVEKINRLQTQIALLQRELAKETQIPSDAEEG